MDAGLFLWVLPHGARHVRLEDFFILVWVVLSNQYFPFRDHFFYQYTSVWVISLGEVSSSVLGFTVGGSQLGNPRVQAVPKNPYVELSATRLLWGFPHTQPNGGDATPIWKPPHEG